MSQDPAVPQPPKANNPQLAKEKYWTTQWAFDDIDAGKLSRRLAAIGIDSGLDVQGKVTVRFNVGIPTSSLRDAAAYRFDGTLKSSSLVIDELQLKEFSTTISYRDGVVTLKTLKSQIVDQASPQILVGEIEGRGSAELVPRGDAKLDIGFKDFSLAPVYDLAAKFLVTDSSQQTDKRIPTAGKLSGKVKFSVPLATVGKIETYQLEGAFYGQQLEIAGLPPVNFDAEEVQIANQTLKVSSFLLGAGIGSDSQAVFRMLGKATLPLSGVGDFQFEIAGDDVPVGPVAAVLTQADPTIIGKIAHGKVDFRVTGNGQVSEQIERSSWQVQGSVASPRLRIAGLDWGTLEHHIQSTPTQLSIETKRTEEELPKTFRLKHFRCNHRISADSLAIEDVDASLFGGQLTGSVSVPLDESGTLTTKLDIESIQPILELPIAGVTGKLSAVLSGNIDWSVPVNAIDKPIQHRGQAKIVLKEINLGATKVGDLQALASAEMGELSLTATGNLFDGTITAETTAAMRATDRWSDLATRLNKTVLDFDGVSLSNFFAMTVGQRVGLTGLASGKVTIASFHPAQGSGSLLPDAEIMLDVNRLSQRSLLLSRSIRLEGKLRSDRFEIDSFFGDYAGGSARIHGRVYLVDSDKHFHPRVDLRLSSSQTMLDRGLWFLGDFADDFLGRASITATMAGNLESIRIRGSVDGRD